MTDIIECVTSFKHKKKCTKRQLQQLIGKLAFAAECVRSGRLFISRMSSVLRKYKYNHYRVSLNNEFCKDVMWWIEFFKTFNGLYYIPEVVWTPPDIIFSNDASLQGLGGVNFVVHEYFHVDIPEKFKDLHIGVYEMLAVYIALKLWQNDLVNKHLRIHCDNQSVIHIINSGKGRDGSMLHFARQISMICTVFYLGLKRGMVIFFKKGTLHVEFTKKGT
jgi:hypothetical protein